MFQPLAEIQTSIDDRPGRAANESRRRFLKFALSAAAAYRMDRFATVSHWDPSDTEMYVMPSDTRPPNTNGWLVAPGYGSIHGVHMAHQVHSNKGITGNAPIGAYVYGNSLVTPDQIKQRARRFAAANNLSKLNVYSHSMGGLIGLTGGLATGLPFRRIILNASPFDIDDADLSGAARVAATVSEITGYRGSLVSKYLATLYTRFHQHGVDNTEDFFNNFIVAGEQAWNGADPQCMGSQLVMLNSEPIRYQDYRHSIIPGITEVAYCMPQHPEDDMTVRVTQAADKWEEKLFGPLGVEMQRLSLPLPRDPTKAHANTEYAMAYTSDFIRTGRVLDHNPAP
jgi:hypothetical protein